MRRPGLVDVHLQLGKPASQHAGGARVVEMDVGEEQGARLGLEAGQERLHRRGGPGVGDDAGGHLPGADHAVAAQVDAVDKPRHARQIRSAGRGRPGR